jgi:hypothetical protein
VMNLTSARTAGASAATTAQARRSRMAVGGVRMGAEATQGREVNRL